MAGRAPIPMGATGITDQVDTSATRYSPAQRRTPCTRQVNYVPQRSDASLG